MVSSPLLQAWRATSSNPKSSSPGHSLHLHLIQLVVTGLGVEIFPTLAEAAFNPFGRLEGVAALTVALSETIGLVLANWGEATSGKMGGVTLGEMSGVAGTTAFMFCAVCRQVVVVGAMVALSGMACGIRTCCLGDILSQQQVKLAHCVHIRLHSHFMQQVCCLKGNTLLCHPMSIQTCRKVLMADDNMFDVTASKADGMDQRPSCQQVLAKHQSKAELMVEASKQRQSSSPGPKWKQIML